MLSRSQLDIVLQLIPWHFKTPETQLANWVPAANHKLPMISSPLLDFC